MNRLKQKFSTSLQGGLARSQDQAGFTLIELLVVMLILGILATIALPAFFNQRSKAGDAKAKENAHSAQVAMETCATDSAMGLYTGCDLTALRAIEPTIPATGVTATAGTPTGGYTIVVTGSAGTYSVVRATAGTMTYPCTPTVSTNRGGCPTSGFWG